MKPGQVRAAPLHHPARRVGPQYPAGAVAALACPHCGDQLTADTGPVAVTGPTFRCAQGHTFDIARQGYVALLTPRSRTDSADNAEMVAARADFLGAGHFAPIAAAVALAVVAPAPAPAPAAAAAAAEATGGPAVPGRPVGPVLEVGAGTGYYLRAALDAAGPAAAGVALDASRYAARRAAADPRTVSVVADAWSPLPLRDRSIGAVTSIFAPRNPLEIARVMAPGATFVAVTPQPAHLAELRERLTMVTVDDGKAERLVEKFDGLLQPTGHQQLTFELRLRHADVAALVGMGPSARHVSAAELAGQIEALPAEMTVTAAVTVSTFTNR